MPRYRCKYDLFCVFGCDRNMSKNMRETLERMPRRSARIRSALRFGALAAVAALAACSSVENVHVDSRHYLERAQTQAINQFTVTAAALTSEESREVFGVPLNNVGIQPVWLRIENHSSHAQWLFPIGIDDNYFPSYEVARRMSGFSELPEEEIYRRLDEAHIDPFLPGGAVASGFVYTHDDEGMKAFNVELHSANDTHNFHFVAPVPGLPSDYFDIEDGALPAGTEISDLTVSGFREWLESIGCCTTNDEGIPGDPLNIVFVGTLDQVRGTLISNNWDVTAPVTGASLWRMATAFIFGSRYRYAPISSLYVFGREQDLAFQKSRAVIDERNHMRLWQAPVTVEGSPVWIGQVSRDVGIKFSGRLWPPTTHVVDPDIDDARFYVHQELTHSGALSRVGYVEGHVPASHTEPHRNAEGDPYFTDGLRAVFFMSERPVARTDIDLLRWELPPSLLPYREQIFAEDNDSLSIQ